ncbi:hypothetical protein [Streptomyces sp. AN091965]|uniref:hypothetical protein n=1 Tax=Streptomyces sp. AN091965 TaxID=2927803 RepID=UPI001F615299|nr:hypothetical protein [Streptomyces sp. AN091965]MCI3928810.1 hypothetical protein [Streptomyces sp. AN091965]
MSTRGFLGFVVDGKEKISYNQHDSQPHGLGTVVMEWAYRANKKSAKEAARSLRVVTDDDVPTAKEIEHLKPYTDDVPHDGEGGPMWDELLWKIQGDPSAILDSGYLADASGFAGHFAEWGYLVNFDTRELEVYRGHQLVPHRDGRFSRRTSAHEGHFPVRLVGTFPLDEPDYEALRALES